MGQIDDRLAELGYVLPTPTSPAGNYVNVVRTGNLIFTAGHVSQAATGELITGKVGKDLTPEEGYVAAHRVVLSLLATLKKELGDLDHIKRIVKLTGFVNCVDGFAGQPAVINGASDALAEIFGAKGKHARSAVGTNALPVNVAVEIEAIVEVEPSAPSLSSAL
uniref:Endoribonuclease L-PSP/chorismate mutase-like domain-containing protein n=1 Tax=Globisporangium ultimum (strain ATCC 200006 / CBS 805.95 / DAOM BR144) TaxID=431595 RepID=K3WJH4_GLOUD